MRLQIAIVCSSFAGHVLSDVFNKFDRECNFNVAFLFVLPVFGALLWAKVWAWWVFFLISAKCNGCKWLYYAGNHM